MICASVLVEGQGLHGGVHATVRLSRCDGTSRVVQGGASVALDVLEAVATPRSTSVRSGRIAIATVEHLFAAIAALGARRGLEVAIDGPEVPLADGGARTFFDAIASLGIPPTGPRLCVVRDAALDVSESRYTFRRAPDGGSQTLVEVAIDFGDPRLTTTARWNGGTADFGARIAGARTFGFERDIEGLMARGLASHVAPESVVVVCKDRVLAAGRPFEADEPARHKLLDLVGDLGAHGGPPLGEVVAVRPGHAATHEAVRRALDAGVLGLIDAR